MLFATSFNLDGTLRTELDFPNVLDVDAGFAGPVALTWDPRAFDVAESIIIVFADGRPRAEVTGDQSGPGALTLSLPSGATRILLQARPLLRYPADLVDDLAATQVTVNSEVTQLPLRTQAAAAWGAELYVSWFAYEDRYLPALVEVRSVGPHPTPSGLTVELRVPRPTLGELEPDPSADSSRLDRAGAKPGISIVVDPMPAGASWQTTFELPEDAAEQEPSKPGLTVVPTAALVFTEVVAGDARDTALYSSAPVTASGSSLSDFASEQKA
ncbi:hypothetical protein [Microbacterium aurum]|uniref:hypothetical protein n=1 Tax=Microbacterium aurum TaxID=36805 RepID=UPI001EF5CA28|nr:hypothetical protein [Microbacterium aurum]MCG7415795.1 hypothetical protein [Microbacterium aurum]